MKKIRVGTRGSQLAVAQTDWVIEQIEALQTDIMIEKIIIKTKGDKILDKALDKIGDKGLFVKEIETALLKGDIDLAIHSMKDLPSDSPAGLVIVDPPKREEPWDVLVLSKNYKHLSEIPKGSQIGSGSKRRAYQLKQLRADIEVVPIRGNVQTRVGKIESESLAGTILAKAGLNRLGFKGHPIYELSLDEMVPAPAQGLLGLQCRTEDHELIELLGNLKDEDSSLQFHVERSFMKALNGSCHVPMGCYAELSDEDVIIHGLYGDKEGHRLIRKQVKTNRINSINEAIELGKWMEKEIHHD